MKNTTRLILFLSVFISLSLVFWFFLSKKINAESDYDVFEWAWSENTGWKSFNSTNCDKNGNGIIDSNEYEQNPECPPVGTSIGNYRVKVDAGTGRLSGWVWSSNIGWITFNRAVTGQPPDSPDYGDHLARVDLDNCSNNICPVYGWARVYAAINDPNFSFLPSNIPKSNYWPNDGWIKLRGMTQTGGEYGVSLDMNEDPPEFLGYAWAPDNVGWIKLKGNIINSAGVDTGDYSVKVKLEQTPPPSLSCDAGGPYTIPKDQEGGLSGIIYQDGEEIAGPGDSLPDGFTVEWSCEGPGDFELRGETTLAPVFTPYEVTTPENLYSCTLRVERNGDSTSCTAEITVKEQSTDVFCVATPRIADVEEEVTFKISGINTDDYSSINYTWDEICSGPEECEVISQDGECKVRFLKPGNYSFSVEVNYDSQIATPTCNVIVLNLPKWLEIPPFLR